MLTIEKAPPRWRADMAINLEKLAPLPTKKTDGAQHLRVVRFAKPTALQARAMVRLRELSALRDLHLSHGIVDEIDPWGRVVIDALAELAGFQHWALDCRMLRAYLPGNIDDAEADRLLSLPRRDGRLISNKRAGQMLGFTLIEHRTIVEDLGLVITLNPIDEDPVARALRRAERKKKMCREQKRRARAKMRTSECNFEEPESNIQMSASYNRYLNKGADRNVTFRPGKGPALIIDAIRSGSETISEIAAKTSLSAPTIRVALPRLVEAGHVIKTARGRYAAGGSEAAPQSRQPADHETQETDGTTGKRSFRPRTNLPPAQRQAMLTFIGHFAKMIASPRRAA